MTRLAGIGRGRALGLLALLLLLIGYGLTLTPSQGRMAQAPGQSDAALYRAIGAKCEELHTQAVAIGGVEDHSTCSFSCLQPSASLT